MPDTNAAPANEPTITGRAILELDLSPGLSVDDIHALHSLAIRRGVTFDTLVAETVRALAAEARATPQAA